MVGGPRERTAYNPRIDSVRAIAVIWIAALLMPAAAVGERGSQSTDRAVSASAYYAPCPSFRYRGRHKLFRHALSCATAKRKARYVLKHRTHPRGWRCSLANLADGYGACTRRGHAFEFLPL